MKKTTAFLALLLIISMFATTAFAQSKLLDDFEKTDEKLLIWANQSGKTAEDCVIQYAGKAKIALEKTNPISGKASLSITMIDGVASERVLATPFGSKDWSGKNYLGMSIKNTNESDVSIYLSILQYNDKGKESWTLSSHSEDIIVVNKNGTLDNLYTIDSYGLLIEAGFEGTVYFPLYPKDVEYSPAEGEVYKNVGVVQMFFNVTSGEMADKPLYFDNVSLCNKEDIKTTTPSNKPTPTKTSATPIVTVTETATNQPITSEPVVTTEEPATTAITTSAVTTTPIVSDAGIKIKNQSNLWIWLISAAVVIAAGVIAAIIIKKKKASS